MSLRSLSAVVCIGALALSACAVREERVVYQQPAPVSRPVPVYAVQAAGASATHDGWHAGKRLVTDSANTIADGLATRSSYEMTFDALREGLADFITVTDTEIANAMRLLLRSTHSLVEGAGAAGMAGLLALRERLAGQRVGIVLSGGNVDERTLTRVLNGDV